MTRSRQLLGSLLAGTAVTVGGCGQSAQPPAVAVAPAVAVVEQPDQPAAIQPAAEKPVPEKPPAEQVAKADPPAPVPDGGTFPYPDDAGGKALAKTLTPAAPPPAPAAPPSPRERPLPAAVSSPAPPIPDAAGAPPRLTVSASRPVRPAPLPDRFPPDLGGVIPPLPARPELLTGPLTRTDGPDLARPAELPSLSPRPVADRAPLTDPTQEFTAQSVVSPSLPLRTEPAGFQKINLPDPFENADAAKPRTPVEENPNRSLGSTPPPPR